MPYGLLPSALAGLALWSVAATVAGGREPWDTPAFWSVWWPLAIALSVALGLIFPRRGWAWSFVVMAMLAPVMVLNGAGLSMMPPGLILLALLALPGAIAGGVAAALARRRARS